MKEEIQGSPPANAAGGVVTEVVAGVGLRNRARQVISQDLKPQILTPAPIRSNTSKRGLSNGVGETNGTSFVNGMKTGATNGASFVNGKKNATGPSFVNGTGVSNGLKYSGRRRAQSRMNSLLMSWKFMSILVALLVIIPLFVYISASHEGNQFAIDGKFAEWKDSTQYGVRLQSSSPSVNVEHWSVATDKNIVYVYAKMQSDMMVGSDVESMFFYIDSDHSTTTGYAVGGLGADYLVELDGWNGTVAASTLSRFTSDDTYNWNGWDNIGAAAGIVAGDQIEASALLSEALPSNAEFLLVAQNKAQSLSVSYEVPARGGLLVVHQTVPQNVSSTGIVPASADSHVLNLQFTCQGEGGRVEGVTPVLSVGSMVSQIPSFGIRVGETKTYEVRADLSQAREGALVSAALESSGISTSFSDVQIVGDGCLAYVDIAPGKIDIDGAFGDWQGRVEAVESNSTARDDLKIDAVGAVNDSAEAYFFLSVEGQVCSGTYVPTIRAKPSGSGGGGLVILPRVTAEDEMRVYIDSDRSSLTGLPVAIDQMVIGADHLISIKGLFGKITGIVQYSYSSGEWTRTQSIASAAKDEHRIEVGVSSSSIGTSSAVDFVIQTTSWRGVEDAATCPVLPDPWVIRSSGADYRSPDGFSWGAGYTITLSGGDTVIDMATNPTKDFVYAITNSGRVYQWQIGTSSGWGTNITDPVNGTANIVAIVPYDRGTFIAGYALASDGRLWKTLNLDGSQKAWTWVKKIADGVTDFTDMEYQKTGADFYAIRAGANTPVYWAAGTMNWATTAATGSTTTQTHLLHIGASRQINERIIVLCRNGNMRDSADGGASWAALGNLPTPSGGNASTMYMGMDFDPQGYLWVITDTGWCFRSSDTTTYATFTCTGRATTLGGIVAIACPIPEFPSAIIPIFFVLGLIVTIRFRRRQSKQP